MSFKLLMERGRWHRDTAQEFADRQLILTGLGYPPDWLSGAFVQHSKFARDFYAQARDLRDDFIPEGHIEALMRRIEAAPVLPESDVVVPDPFL